MNELVSHKPFIAQTIDLVDHHRLLPADYNPRQMDPRTLRLLVRSLATFGWVMPVVANRRTGNIVGGHQRIRANAQLLKTPSASAYRRVPVIYVDLSEGREKALNVALNQISGDWDFFKRAAADELRQNATYAQMTREHHALSRAYRAPLQLKAIGALRSAAFDFRDAQHAARFIDVFGSRILDFGCGRGQEIRWLSRIGINARGFEPFQRNRRGRLTAAHSRAQADQLLTALAAGFVPDTVFCNYVVSSIASPADRAHVLTIVQALATRGARAVIAVRSTDDVCYQQVLGNVRVRKGGYLGIPDSSERGLIVTSAGTAKQKFQKFFERAEFIALLKRYFGRVEIRAIEPNDPALVAVCTQPRPLDRDRLARALKFEFDLPVAGQRLDRAAQAIRVFSRWLACRTPIRTGRLRRAF